MSITPQTEERPGYPHQEIHQAARESVTHEGEPMNPQLTPAKPSAEELCNIMSDLAGFEIDTVDDMAKFAHQVGVAPFEFIKAAETIAIIEAALHGGEL